MKKFYTPRTNIIIRKIFRGVTWNIKNGPKAVYLTFDDGPNPGITEEILEILKKYNALAVFFCKGSNVAKYPDLYERIIKEGHSVGNHGFKHLKGWYTKNKDYFEDISLARKYINSELFRPPFGKITFSQIRHLKHQYKIIMWDIMSFDFDHDTSTQECIENVLKNVRPGSIVTFHDSPIIAEKITHSLPIIIEKLLAQGYSVSYNLKKYLA